VATKTTRFGQGNIDPQRWDRLKTILGEALEQNSSAARIALVERRCGQDTDLLEEAESLLAEADALLKEHTDSFEDCARNAASTFWQEGPPRGGERVGAYVIVRELGRGGISALLHHGLHCRRTCDPICSLAKAVNASTTGVVFEDLRRG